MANPNPTKSATTEADPVLPGDNMPGASSAPTSKDKAPASEKAPPKLRSAKRIVMEQTGWKATAHLKFIDGNGEPRKYKVGDVFGIDAIDADTAERFAAQGGIEPVMSRREE